MKLAYRRWHPKLDWTTPAGKALQALAAALPSKPSFRITVFGSAALQLGLDRRFLSADVDIFLYRPALPGERPSGDIIENTRSVWRELFGKDIQVQERIIEPALTERADAYGLNLPDWKGQLRRLGAPKRGKRAPRGT